MQTMSFKKNASTLGRFLNRGFKCQMRLASGHASKPHAEDVHIVSVLGIPMYHGQTLFGTHKGPEVMRQQGLISRIRNQGYIVEDIGDLEMPRRSEVGASGKYSDVVGEGCRLGAEKVAEIVGSEEPRFLITLGGDHSIGLATMSGVLKVRPNTGVIWIDAHADLHTPDSSATGNFHGMPVGIAMKLQDVTTIPGMSWAQSWPTLKPEQIVYIGLREVDGPEKKRIKELGIKSFSMHHVDRYGIGRVMEETLDHLKGRPLHVSFDIDACDPVFAGSTGTTVRGGLTYRESSYILEAAAVTKDLLSLDLVEVNPLLTKVDEKDGTVETAISMIESALGASILE